MFGKAFFVKFHEFDEEIIFDGRTNKINAWMDEPIKETQWINKWMDEWMNEWTNS